MALPYRNFPVRCDTRGSLSGYFGVVCYTRYCVGPRLVEVSSDVQAMQYNISFLYIEMSFFLRVLVLEAQSILVSYSSTKLCCSISDAGVFGARAIRSTKGKA